MRILLFVLFVQSLAAALPVAPLERTSSVNFETEILPFLRESCLACHNQTKAKADLILESPLSIAKGGDSGPAVVPGKPAESLLFKVAAHLEKPFMPPADNKVNAPNLHPEQLALLKLWIEQGASGEVHSTQTVAWRSLSDKGQPILSLAVTDDAQFAAGGRGNQLYIFQIPTGRQIGPLVDPQLHTANAAHLDLVQSLDFSPDGELLASGSYREVKLWRRQHEPRLNTLREHISKASWFSPGLSQYASVSASNLLQIWNLTETNVLHELQLENAPQALTWFSAGSKLAAAFGTNIQVWNRDLSSARTIISEVSVTFLCGTTNQIISANEGGLIQSWNSDSGEKSLSFTNGNPIAAIAVSPDGKVLALAENTRSIRLLKLEDQKTITELKGTYPSVYRLNQALRTTARLSTHLGYRKSMVEKSEKERQAQVERVRKASEQAGLAVKGLAENETQVKAGKSEESTGQKELDDVKNRLKTAEENATKALAELEKTKTAVKSAEKDALEARLIELVTVAGANALASNTLASLKPELEKQQKVAEEKLKAAQKKVADLAAAAQRLQLTNSAAENELHFAITSAQNALDSLTSSQNAFQLTDTDGKQNEFSLQKARVALTNSLHVSRSLSFSADGAILADSSSEGTTLWSIQNNTPLYTTTNSVSVLGVSTNGQFLTFSEGKLDAWDPAPHWKLERTIVSADGLPAFADRVNTVRFSPDGLTLATGGGEPSRSGEVKIWRVKDGQLVHDFKNAHSDTVLALSYSPDGHYLASGAADRFAKVFDLSNGKIIRILEGHTHHVLGLSWKSDGHTIMTAGADKVVKVWDAFSGEKKKNIDGFNKEVTAVSYIGDTDQAVASCGDATLRLVKENGEKIRSYEGATDYLHFTVASSDGNLVLAASQDGILRVWRADTGKQIAEYSPRSN